MTANNNKNISVVTVDPKDSVIVGAEAIQKNAAKKSVSDTSTQRQLITLAKQFALEGALVAPEKQFPVLERVEKYEQKNKIRRQKNLEMIIYKALSYSSKNEVADRADADWFNNFILLAENISNSSMQELWAKILAGELARPGSFSLKALKVFKEMSISDAKQLAKARSLSVRDNASTNMRIISGAYQKPNVLSLFFGQKQKRINLAEFGLNYSDLLALAENNLIFIQEAETRALTKNTRLFFDYNGKAITLSYKIKDISINFYKFTAVGNELSQLISNNPELEFFGHLKLQLSEFVNIICDN